MDSHIQEPGYRIEPSRPTGDELLRIANDQVEFAISAASPPIDDAHEDVHRCRKSIKRLRALVRLGAAGDAESCAQIDRELRNAGRALAPARDVSVIRQSLRALATDAASIDELERIVKPALWPVDIEPAAAAAVVTLRRSAQMLADYFADAQQWNVARLAVGTGDTYEHAAIHMERFERRNTDARAHSWRKDLQRHLNQMRLVEAFAPGVTGPRLARLNKLASVLGEHHDLAILRAQCKHARSTSKPIARLRRKAKRRQKKLAKRALKRGAKLFTDDTEVFIQRLFGNTVSGSLPIRDSDGD